MLLVIDTIFTNLEGLFCGLREVEKSEKRAGELRRKAQSMPGVRTLDIGGQDVLCMKMNLFGGIAALLVLLQSMAENSIFDAGHTKHIAIRLNGFNNEFKFEDSQDPEVQRMLTEAIAFFDK